MEGILSLFHAIYSSNFRMDLDVNVSNTREKIMFKERIKECLEGMDIRNALPLLYCSMFIIGVLLTIMIIMELNTR